MCSLVTKKTFSKTIPQTLRVKHEKQFIPAKKSKVADATIIRTHIPVFGYFLKKTTDK
jgi:hypothetical protein